MEVFTAKERFCNTIATIEYAENYEKHSEKFEKAISLLKNRVAANDFSEFNDTERAILEEALTLMED